MSLKLLVDVELADVVAGVNGDAKGAGVAGGASPGAGSDVGACSDAGMLGQLISAWVMRLRSTWATLQRSMLSIVPYR